MSNFLFIFRQSKEVDCVLFHTVSRPCSAKYRAWSISNSHEVIVMHQTHSTISPSVRCTMNICCCTPITVKLRKGIKSIIIVALLYPKKRGRWRILVTILCMLKL